MNKDTKHELTTSMLLVRRRENHENIISVFALSKEDENNDLRDTDYEGNNVNRATLGQKGDLLTPFAF